MRKRDRNSTQIPTMEMRFKSFPGRTNILYLRSSKATVLHEPASIATEMKRTSDENFQKTAVTNLIFLVLCYCNPTRKLKDKPPTTGRKNSRDKPSSTR